MAVYTSALRAHVRLKVFRNVIWCKTRGIYALAVVKACAHRGLNPQIQFSLQAASTPLRLRAQVIFALYVNSKTYVCFHPKAHLMFHSSHWSSLFLRSNCKNSTVGIYVLETHSYGRWLNMIEILRTCGSHGLRIKKVFACSWKCSQPLDTIILGK